MICANSVNCEYVKNFKIEESVPIGTRIGYIGTPVPGQPRPPGPPYLVVPSADSPIADDLDVDQNTGEIRWVLEFFYLFREGVDIGVKIMRVLKVLWICSLIKT